MNDASTAEADLFAPNLCSWSMLRTPNSHHRAAGKIAAQIDNASITGFLTVSANELPACVVQRPLVIDAPATFLLALRAAHSASMRTSAEAHILYASTVLKRTYSLEDQGRPRAAARELMVALEACLKRNSLIGVNCVLSQVEPERLSSRSMIGLIRTTARVRKLLPAWKQAYEQSWRQVALLGKSPESLFIGLPKVQEEKCAGAAR